MGRKKQRGHYCWCCGRRRPNEQFSGRGHRDHLCRECARLPLEAREYHQAVRDLERDWFRPGKRARRQKAIQRFLEHHLPAVRAHAEALVREELAPIEEDEEFELELVGWFDPEDPWHDQPVPFDGEPPATP